MAQVFHDTVQWGSLSLTTCDAAPPAKQDPTEVQLMVKPLVGPTFPLVLPSSTAVAALYTSLGQGCKIDPSAFHLFSFVGGLAPVRLPADGQSLRAVGLTWDSVVTMKLAAPLPGGVAAAAKEEAHDQLVKKVATLQGSKKMTQKQMAKGAGVTEPDFSQWRNSKKMSAT